MRVHFPLTAMLVALGVFAACGNNANSTPPAAPTASAYAAYPPPGYPAPTAPPGYTTAYPPPPAAPYPAPGQVPVAPAPYATPTATYAQPTPAPGPVAPAPAPAPVPAPVTSGTMATPGLLALPCQSDATCGLHHCNTQYGKCAFPCQTAADCIAPYQCVMGVCLPGGGS